MELLTTLCLDRRLDRIDLALRHGDLTFFVPSEGARCRYADQEHADSIASRGLVLLLRKAGEVVLLV